MASMDLQTRETAWNNRSTNIFNNSTEPVGNSDFTKLCNDILHLHKTITRLWWNIRTLEEYLRQKIFPRGLRIQIFPSWEIDTDEKNTWEKGLSQCSLILVNMLLDHDRELLTQQREAIKKLESRLTTFDITLVDPFRKKLQENIDDYEKNIITNKQHKFQRDKTDYEKGKAYHWTHRGNKRRFYSRMPYNKSTAGPQISDSQSTDFSESDNSEDTTPRQHNTRKRGPRHREWSPNHKRDKTVRGKKTSAHDN
ncbi:uncharacterized protein [Engystomops pustulosus]|uniref:uncharacterized protein isoform X1 n=1 Tax=Engystomops pustulosus TaxID=76066 RepID=UPI003AFA5229